MLNQMIKQIFSTWTHRIKDVTDKENPIVLVNKRNAIHFGNFAKHLAFSLANKSNHGIFFMNFGNGGSYINTNGEVVYKTTNTLMQSVLPK